MTIDFNCQKCDSAFELDAQDLIDGTEKLVCPHCDATAPATLVDDFIGALTEMRAQVAALEKKFTVSFNVETEELAQLHADAELDDEDDEDLDDDDEDDDLDDVDEDEEDLEDEDADEA